MTDEEIRIFIEGVVRYFERVTGQAASVDAPFLKGDEEVALEYTGVIGISGRHRGAVYFTTDGEMLGALLASFGEPSDDLASRADLVGEVANTIAGNARRFFGSDFMISVPIVLRGQPDGISMPRHLKSFVIPILWRSFRSYLLVCVQRSATGLAAGSEDSGIRAVA